MIKCIYGFTLSNKKREVKGKKIIIMLLQIYLSDKLIMLSERLDAVKNNQITVVIKIIIFFKKNKVKLLC